MKKIIVLGCSGSGKSTFAVQLQNITKLPLYHLDNIWWKPDRTHISRDEFDRKLDDLINRDNWIIDRVGKERRDIPWTDNKLNPELVKLVKNYETVDKPVLIELFNKFSDKDIIILHSREEANALLKNIITDQNDR